MTDKTPVTSPSAPAAGPYSPGLSAGEWVFLAGQTGTGETIEDQTESTLGKVTVALGREVRPRIPQPFQDLQPLRAGQGGHDRGVKHQVPRARP